MNDLDFYKIYSNIIETKNKSKLQGGIDQLLMIG